MPFHHTFVTARTTRPDNEAMHVAIKAATGDPTAVLTCLDGSTAFGKKASAWTPSDIQAAQGILDTAAALTPQVEAQRFVDQFSIAEQAVILALLDEINLLRSKLSPPLQARTPQQALAAIKAKAATL